jgi:hypothetical protein
MCTPREQAGFLSNRNERNEAAMTANVNEATALLLQAVALLTGGQGVEAPEYLADNDPLTAPLDSRAVWRPGWLKRRNAAVLARFPGLIRMGASIGLDGRPTTSTPIKLIDGFVFHGVDARQDLTASQRASLVREGQRTFLATLTGDFASSLPVLPIEGQEVTTTPGYWTASVHQSIRDPADLERRLDRLYRIHDLLP